MRYPEIKSLPLNPGLEGFSRLDVNIPYSDRAGCTLDLLLPWANQHQDILGDVKYPLVVFIQGSSWTTADRLAEIPQLSALSRKGFVVATVGHRSCLDGYPAPAFLVDVKTAIRFLRAHARQYSIDPDRVAVWGTSSGGNAALLVGLTAGDVMTFGDSGNDIAMTQWAGMGVAMGSGRDELKAVADYVCEPGYEDGIAKTLRKIETE